MQHLNFFRIFMLIISIAFPITAFSAVLVKAKMWPKHSTLNVVFLDGNQKQIQQVKRWAPLWTQESSLRLQFYEDPKKLPTQSHIRVSFKAGIHSQSGARLGDHGDYDSPYATLLLPELNDEDLFDDFAKRLILHEFGHAFGFEHEYRNPKWPYGTKTLDRHVVNCLPRIQKLGYSPETAQEKCRKINQPLKASLIFSTIFDKHSIMNYSQSIKLPNEQTQYIREKYQLSVLDKLAMQRWYGK